MRGRANRIRAAKTKGLNTGDKGEHRVKRFSPTGAFERTQIKNPTLSHRTRQGWGTRFLVELLFERAKVEQVHQIADGWAVQRDVGVAAGDGIREIVAAAAGERRQSPVGFDELQDRNVVGIRVRDMPRRGE